MNNIQPILDKVTALDTRQVAYPVGINKDSYTIQSWFRQNIETESITAEHRVIKNWITNKAKELFIGSYKECYQYIFNLVKEIEQNELNTSSYS